MLEIWEEVPEGSLRVDFASDNPFWTDQNKNEISDAVVGELEELYAEYPSVVDLKGIIITSDVVQCYNEIAQECNCLVPAVNMETGIVGGKVLRWSKDNKDQVVIFYLEEIIGNLLNRNEPNMGLIAKGLLRHEFMHIIQEEIFNKSFGINRLSQNITIRDLELINKFIAESAFSEYFANQKSIQLFKQAAHEVTEFNLLVDTITECTEKVAELREQITNANNIDQIYKCWSIITGYVSKLVNAIGRALSLCDDDRTADLLNDMLAASCPSWIWVIGEFYMALPEIQVRIKKALSEGNRPTREDLFPDLYSAVESCFHQLSVKAELDDEGHLKILVK